MTCVEHNICIYNYMYIIYIIISISKWICIYIYYVYTRKFLRIPCVYRPNGNIIPLDPLNLTHVALAGVPMPQHPWPLHHAPPISATARDSRGLFLLPFLPPPRNADVHQLRALLNSAPAWRQEIDGSQAAEFYRTTAEKKNASQNDHVPGLPKSGSPAGSSTSPWKMTNF